MDHAKIAVGAVSAHPAGEFGATARADAARAGIAARRRSTRAAWRSFALGVVNLIAFIGDVATTLAVRRRSDAADLAEKSPRLGSRASFAPNPALILNHVEVPR
jgi:hypothetical protein